MMTSKEWQGKPLPQHHQQSQAPSVKTSKTEQIEPMPEPPPTVCGVIFIFFLNITHPLMHLLHQDILSPVSAFIIIIIIIFIIFIFVFF